MPPRDPRSRPQPWFVRRRFGAGYRPPAWQGWAIAAALLAAAIVVLVLVHASGARIAVLLVVVGSYTAVRWRFSGEPPDAADAPVERTPVAAREPVERTPEQVAAIARLRPESPSVATTAPSGRIRRR
jgi:hypothetical protein